MCVYADNYKYNNSSWFRYEQGTQLTVTVLTISGEEKWEF